MHRLLERQIARARRSGELDLEMLLRFVDAAYLEADVERARTERAMLLACEEMEQLNAELLALAHHDVLTGLPNRLSFAATAMTAVAQAAPGESLAVLLVDLDRFKAVNDTLGHAMGDALLCEVAARLRAAVREGDTVARMGGDEFAIIQCGFDLQSCAEQLARRVVDRLSAPYVVRGIELAVGASVGVAFGIGGDVSSMNVDLLLGNADRALYRAKREGRCTWRTYEPDLPENTDEVRRPGRYCVAPPMSPPAVPAKSTAPGTADASDDPIAWCESNSRRPHTTETFHPL